MYLLAATGASNMEPIHAYMTDSTDNATPLKSDKSTNSNFTVQIQIQPKSPFEFVPRDTEQSKFLDLVGVGNVAVSVESVNM